MKKLKFINPFLELGADFYTKLPAEKFAKKPFLIHANKEVADIVGLSAEDLQDKNFANYFSGNLEFENSESFASVYSGHQFGGWAGQLGDGRALFLGQIKNAKNELYDIQLKGAGKTPYSRFGDGRAVLRSTIREYLCSHAMTHLGIESTLGLCMVGTEELVARETLEPGAILTRVAKSHIRFGHFEHFFALKKFDQVKILADYVIQNHFPEIIGAKNVYESMLGKIVEKTAIMIANWQSVGFCHGVMNTDNMSIIGLTLDYGPFGFVENFNPSFISNHSDHTGRYALNQQPAIAVWNLHCLAYSLTSLIKIEDSMMILKNFEKIFYKTYHDLMHKKLALKANKESDELIFSLLKLLEENQADYTLTMRYLADVFADEEKWLALFHDKNSAKTWLKKYKNNIENSKISKQDFAQKIKENNPKFILRNWVAEICIRKAQDEKNYKMIDDLIKIFSNPFLEHEEFEYLSKPAPQQYQDLSVSCSS